MKKSILAVAGLAAVAGVAAAPVAGVFATASVTDTLSVTISSACTLGYGTSAHTNGTTGTWGTGASINTLSRTLTNSDADTAIGTTNMTVSCNDNGGYEVTLDASALTGGTTSKTIPYITTAAAPASGTSSWGVSTGSTPTWILDEGVVTSKTGAVSGDTFSVTYGAATSATQEADTYTGTAAYTVSHPKTQSTSQ